MIRQDKFTEQAQEVLASSQEIVRRYRHNQWDVEHVLLAMLEQRDGIAGEIVRKLGADPADLAGRVQIALANSPTAGEGAQIYATPRISQLFETAQCRANGGRLPATPCPRCGRTMEVDDLEEQYLLFVREGA